MLLVPSGRLGATEPAGGQPGEAPPPAEADCPDEVTPPGSADDADSRVQYFIETRVGRRLAAPEENGNSHRRHAYDKSRRLEQPTPPRFVRVANDPSVHPMERLRGQVTRDDFLYHMPGYPFVRQSTLAEAIRRLAGWGDSCPMCGKPHADDENAADAGVVLKAPAAERPVLSYHRLARQAGDAPSPQALRAGEPAQVILDTQKRLGKSVLEGTEFSGSPELLVQWIRALDEENRRRQAAQPAASPYDSIEVALEEDLPVTAHSQVVALREACRQLQQAADVLEEQNLFESADALRTAADGLRRQSREKVGESEQASPDAE
ncbi:MAG TPA: hypothetical protein PK867_06010 [Pirellulales bacterium]|nr:hypothetical protein [Pirellulales bacterium]